MSESIFVASDTPHGDDYDSDKSQDSEAFHGNADDVQEPRCDDNGGIEAVEEVQKEEHEAWCERFECYFNEEDCQEDEVDLVDYGFVDGQESSHCQVIQDEYRV